MSFRADVHDSGAKGERHGEAGLDALARLYERWAFLQSVLDNAEAMLSRLDLRLGRRFAALAGDEGTRIFAEIQAAGGTAAAFRCDITQRAEVDAAVAAAEAAVGLGIILAFYRNKESVNIDEMNLMRS